MVWNFNYVYHLLVIYSFYRQASLEQPMLLYILFIYSCVAMRVLDHTNHGGISMASTVEPEDTWVFRVDNNKMGMNDKTTDSFLIDLKRHLAEDGCMLHISKNSLRVIILIVHCPQIESSNMPQTAHTSSFLDGVFGKHNIVMAKNDISSVHYTQRKNVQRYKSTNKVIYRESDLQMNVPWHLDRISTRPDILKNTYLYNANGTGVDVYVLDTGIFVQHEEFEGRATFLYNAIRDNVNTDCNGHGTHVAGIIGSRTYGVAKNVNLYAVRVLNCTGDGTVADILEGADAVIEQFTARGKPGVINLSLGGDKNDLIEAMIKSLREAGLVVTLAAGNAGMDACQFSPSDMGKGNYVLSIGASNRQDQRTSWSNYGLCVSIFAPGADITSTWFSSKTAIATISGTSMASPEAAGVAALVLEQNNSLTADQVNNLIVQWSTPNVINGDSSLLYSLIDAASPVPQVIPLKNKPLIHSGEQANIGNAPGLLLFIGVTLLWFSCII